MATLPEMLAALGGPSGPSWPYRTKSARQVWDAVSAYIDKNPNTSVTSALQAGFQKAEIPGSELTPEDFDILQLAARWKLSTKPKKKTPTQRAGGLLRRFAASTAADIAKSQEMR
jgi:hypothetical protein